MKKKTITEIHWSVCTVVYVCNCIYSFMHTHTFHLYLVMYMCVEILWPLCAFKWIALNCLFGIVFRAAPAIHNAVSQDPGESGTNQL